MFSGSSSIWATIFGPSVKAEEEEPLVLQRGESHIPAPKSLALLKTDLDKCLEDLDKVSKNIAKNMGILNDKYVTSVPEVAAYWCILGDQVTEWEKWPFGLEEELLETTIWSTNKKLRDGEIKLETNINEPKYRRKEGPKIFSALLKDLANAKEVVSKKVISEQMEAMQEGKEPDKHPVTRCTYGAM